MEKLEYKYKALLKSHNAFERALNLYKSKPGTSQAELEAYTASVIKHFELFYEMLWKFYKIYLFEKYGVETTGSKTVFRSCLNQKIISEEELKQLLEIVEIRNATTHVYNENNSIELCKQIDKHYQILKKLTDSFQK